jgi:hypothetical protein
MDEYLPLKNIYKKTTPKQTENYYFNNKQGLSSFRNFDTLETEDSKN